MRKSIVSIALCLAVLFSMSTTAVASDTINGQSSQSVTGRGVLATEKITVYSVEIEWGSLEFTYEAPADVWNPDTHQYEQNETVSSRWTCEDGADKIIVTNRSNATVDVQITTNMSATGVTASVENHHFVLNSADATVTENNPVGTETKDVARIALAGKLASDHQDGGAVGSVTVILSATQTTEHKN